MLAYMLDTNIGIHVMKTCPPQLRERFNTTAEQLCISSITLGELHYGAEKSARRFENLAAIEQLVERLEVPPFSDKAAAQHGQLQAEQHSGRSSGASSRAALLTGSGERSPGRGVSFSQKVLAALGMANNGQRIYA